MTSRERNLLVLFLTSLAAAVLVVGLGSYLQTLSSLDAEYLNLQKRALRLTQTASVSQGTWTVSSLSRLKEHFFEPGTLQDPLTLATRVQSGLKTAGLIVLESRVMESSAAAQWVQFHAEGGIEEWFRFVQSLRTQDPKTLFRSLSLARKVGSVYAITFEVGHVVLP